MSKKTPLVVAVTGGIGSGQSTVCKFLAKWRCKVINADQKAKDVMVRDKKLVKDIKNTFGKESYLSDGKINTKYLASVAFKDEIQTQRLNQLVHPRMVESIIEDMERARFSGRFALIIIDAALIYEISIEKLFDYVIVVNAPMNERALRVKSRDGMTRQEFQKRVDKQIPLGEKAKWADFVIQNDGSLDELKSATRKVYDQLLKRNK